MNVETGSWIDVGLVTDVPKGGARRVRINDLTIAIFRDYDEQFFALEDQCPHKAGPLSEGIVHNGCVTCPLHNWVISLATGEAQGADEGTTDIYRVNQKAGRLYLDIGSIQ